MRVLLYEDNVAIRDALSVLLGGMPGIQVVGAFANPVQWERQLPAAQPELILMDIAMPGLDGIQATTVIHRAYPHINIVMLTVFEEEDKIFRALCAGAVGYILKNSTPARLVEAMQDAQAGGAPLSPSIARKAVRFFQQISPTRFTHSDAELLTAREHETLKYLVEGLSYKMIADRMGASVTRRYGRT